MVGKYRKTDVKMCIHDIFKLIPLMLCFLSCTLILPCTAMFDSDAKTLFLNCKTII